MGIMFRKVSLWDKKLGTESWVAEDGSRVARGHGSWETWQMRREAGCRYCVSSWQGTGRCTFAGGIERFGIVKV